MAASRTNKKKNNRIEPNLSFRGVKESTLLAFVGISLFLVLSLFSYSPSDPAWSHSISGLLETKVLNMGGYFGAHFADISFYLFGLIAYFIPVLIAFVGWFVYQQMNEKRAQSKWFYVLRSSGFLMTLLSACAIATMHFTETDISLPSDIGSGGIIGEIISTSLTQGFSFIGSTLVLLTLFLVGITWLTNLSWLWLMDVTGKWMLYLMSLCLFAILKSFHHSKNFVSDIYRKKAERKTSLAIIDTVVETEVELIDSSSEKSNTENTSYLRRVLNLFRSEFWHSAKGNTNDENGFIETEQNTVVIDEENSDLTNTDKKTRHISTFNEHNDFEEADYTDSEIDDDEKDVDNKASIKQKFDDVVDKIIPAFLVKHPKEDNDGAYDEDYDENYDENKEVRIDPSFNPLDKKEERQEPSFAHLNESSFANDRQEAASLDNEVKLVEETRPLQQKQQKQNKQEDKVELVEPEVSKKKEHQDAQHPIDVSIKDSAPKMTKRVIQESQANLFKHDTIDQLPALSLLDLPQPSKNITSKEHLEMLSRRIEEKLADYNMTVEVVAVQQGPVITRFELDLAPGIKVSQLTNLSKDLARALLMISIRVVEVIAGKSTVGIEIPNEHREIVSFYDVLNSKAYTESKYTLPLGLGHDISGQPVVADLAKMPHLLVAGTTGSGKSVGVNSMILSMLFHANADELRLIMVDPKMLELSIYEGIPHLLCPVVTDMMEAANALRWCVAEMERRYKLLSALGVRNIAGYNKKVKDAIAAGEPLMDPLFEPNPMMASLRPDPLETLPYIVIVIDEFADMMMVVGKKVEELIARLAQKARAAGMHLIIATQRPSVNVITGLIKANVPTRIAFQVSSKIDSRTILDQMGAQDLLGNGDMLFLPPGSGMPQRVHGAFVSDDEVHSVVNDLKSKGSAEYIEEILTGEGVEGVAGIPGDDSGNEMDPLYDQACAIVIETRKASISGVQRRLKVGYNRAARMVEDMEAAGLVSKVQSNGQREVLAPQN